MQYRSPHYQLHIMYDVKNPKEVAFYALPGALDALGVSVTVTELNKLLKKGLPVIRTKGLAGGKVVRYFKPEACAEWIKEFYPTARIKTHVENNITSKPEIKPVEVVQPPPAKAVTEEWKPIPRQLAVCQTEDVAPERKLKQGDCVEVCRWNGRLLYTPEALLGKRGIVVSEENELGFVKVQIQNNSEAHNISVCNLKLITTKDCMCEYKLRQDSDGSVIIVVRHNAYQSSLAKFRPISELGISADDVLAIAETVVADLL